MIVAPGLLRVVHLTGLALELDGAGGDVMMMTMRMSLLLAGLEPSLRE